MADYTAARNQLESLVDKEIIKATDSWVSSNIDQPDFHPFRNINNSVIIENVNSIMQTRLDSFLRDK